VEEGEDPYAYSLNEKYLTPLSRCKIIPTVKGEGIIPSSF
jgi:hypothetical protein